jgi:tetratricopeptide (TPR) repeat protein
MAGALLLASLASPVMAQDKGPLDQGMALFYQEKYADCIPFFEQEVQQNPKDALALNFLLYSSFKTMSLPTEQNKFEEAAVAHPNDPVALSSLGMVYCFRGSIDSTMIQEAENQFKEALKIDPNCSMAQDGMGLLYYQKRMMPRARGHFLAAMEANGHDLMALERLGEILMVDEKKPDQAIDVFRRITTQAPSYPDGHYFLGSAMYDAGQYDDAMKEFQVCIELDPRGIDKGYDAMMLAGNTLMEKKRDFPGAATWFKKALAVRPDSEYAKVRLEQAQNNGKTPEPKKTGKS